MATLEGFLNVAIPVGIFVFLAAALYWKMKEPLKAFFAWLGSLFGWTKDKLSSGAASNITEEIVYR